MLLSDNCSELEQDKSYELNCNNSEVEEDNAFELNMIKASEQVEISEANRSYVFNNCTFNNVSFK